MSATDRGAGFEPDPAEDDEPTYEDLEATCFALMDEVQHLRDLLACTVIDHRFYDPKAGAA